MSEKLHGAPERHRLPNPRWIPVVAAALLAWSLLLGSWWIRLESTPPVQAAVQPPPTASPTQVAARPAAEPGETARPTTQSIPALSAVLRTSGELVTDEDWLGLAHAFDVEQSLGYIETLIGPTYAGRAVGSDGGRLAADWIAERFAEYGLQPAGDDGTFFQEFSVPYAELTGMPEMQLVDDSGQIDKTYAFREEYTVWMGGYADGGQASGPVVWVANGDHDAYDDVVVQDGVALARFQYPLDAVQRQAVEHGAAALVLWRSDNPDFRMRRTAREPLLLPQGIPTLIIDDDTMAEFILGQGWTVEDLSFQNESRPLGIALRVSVSMLYESEAKGRNVLGAIPGSDPDGVEQVFVLGGHYDHMGGDPDGTIWHGANDNASGVAVLLEIARLWQESGFVPKRTVLFAAWDGEEIGLNGSQYYVDNPRFPLENTVGMLQLDMVGTGTEELAIDAGGLVANQSVLSATELGVPVRLDAESSGRSDHTPFVSAGIPASCFIWWAGDDTGLVYHVPEDDLSNIELEKQLAAGQLANLVTLRFAYDYEELEDAASQFVIAVGQRDATSFPAWVDSANTPSAEITSPWVEALAATPSALFTATVGHPLAVSEAATATVTLRYRWAEDGDLTTTSFPAQWARSNGDWRYAGPTWAAELGEHIVLWHLGQDSLAHSLVSQADDAYQQIVETVGLPLPQPLHIRFFGMGTPVDNSTTVANRGRALMHGLVKAPDGHGQANGWIHGSTVLLSDPAEMLGLLTQLGLQSAGWTTDTAQWLASGVAQRLEAAEQDETTSLVARHMQTLVAADAAGTLWPVSNMPGRWEVASDQRALWTAQAWAMTDDLVGRLGWAGVTAPTETPLSDWRAARLEPWKHAVDPIDELLNVRAEAVVAQDLAAFLSTVDPSDPVLLQEERHWFEDLALHPAESFHYEGQLLELNDDSAVVDLRVSYHVPSTSWKALPIHYRADFRQIDGLWYYSDVHFEEQRSEHYVLKYEDSEYGLFGDLVLREAERAYALVAEDLEVSLATPIEIKLYDQSDLHRFSIYLSMHRITGWNEPGEALKLNVSGSEEFLTARAGTVIAHELTHAALFSMGVQHGAVHEGTAQFEAYAFNPPYADVKIRTARRDVYDLVRSQRDLTIEDLDQWRAKPDDLDLFYSAGWDFVAYMRTRLGREVFLDWLHRMGEGGSFRQAFAEATGIEFSRFDQDWRESVLRGHIPAGQIDTATAFDAQNALRHAAALASTEYAGREAGTDGNDAAATYIASQFAALGLQPAGDDGGYYQQFELAGAVLTAIPQLTCVPPSAAETVTLGYRVDFREALGGSAGGGSAERELVFVRNPYASDVKLGGRIMVTYARNSAVHHAAAATDLGAGALLLLTDTWEKHMAVRDPVAGSLATHQIPVLELTRAAGERLFALAGYATWEIERLPDVLPLPITATVRVPLAVSPTRAVSNVLGVIRGVDPDLSHEVVIVGAHLDHVGQLPDGTIYPGANKDASGVGLMLEIARLWQEEGFKPARTVLFAAWNASEKGLRGSQRYVASPTFPLSTTRAMIQLDEIGQGKGYYISVSGDETADARVIAHLENAAGRVEGRLTFDAYVPDSDHHTFHALGVPAVRLQWQEPEHTNQPTDSPETLDVTKMQAAGRVVALTLMTLSSP